MTSVIDVTALMIRLAREHTAAELLRLQAWLEDAGREVTGDSFGRTQPINEGSAWQAAMRKAGLSDGCVEYVTEHAVVTADAGSALDVAGLTEVIRAYLRAYTLPANVARYLAPGDDHDRVAERCAPLIAEAVAAHVEALREADRAAAIESAVADYERIDSTVPDVMAWFRARAARTEPTPMTAEQRAEVRLTEAERAAMDTAVYTHEDATLEQRTAITAAVERILADRAAAEDHGLRARVEAVAGWLADKEADMRASYRRDGGQYAEGFRDACDVAESRLRAALDGGA